MTLKVPIIVFPDTVQVPGEADEMKFGLLEVKEHVEPEASVLLSVPVTVTHVPGDPRLGSTLRLFGVTVAA